MLRCVIEFAHCSEPLHLALAKVEEALVGDGLLCSYAYQRQNLRQKHTGGSFGASRHSEVSEEVDSARAKLAAGWR